MAANVLQSNNRQRAYSRESLPSYGLSAGEGSASSSGSSLSSSMNRSRTSTGDSSLSTDTNGSAGSGTGIPPRTPPPLGQVLSSSSTAITNTTRRRSHRPRGCRGGRKNRKKNSQSKTTGSSCSTNEQPVPTEIVGGIPLSPRDSNTQNGNNNFSNGTHPSKSNLNLHQPHARQLEVVLVQKMSDGADVSNRNMQHVSDENTHQATMTTNTITMEAEGNHNSVVSSLLPHPQPILAVNINNMSTGQQDQHQQMYTRHPCHPNHTVRFQHHPSHTFIAHPMSYDRSINEHSAYYHHNDGDFHQNADNNNNNIRHQEPQQQQQSTTMDRHFDPSRSVDAIATKSIKQLQMLAASKNMISMGEILPPLPSTKKEDSPVHMGPNPYALTNADQISENTSPIMMASTTTTLMNARSSNESSQFNVQTMNLHHIANAHSDNISSSNNNNNNCLSSSMTQDCYRNERLEKQRQMLADGGSLFVVSPRSFLTGVKVQPTTTTATTTTAW